MKHRKGTKLFSILLALCLLFSLLPSSALAATTQTTSTQVSTTDTTEDETTYLAFGSDRHAKGTNLTNILAKIVSDASDITFVGLIGDMVDNTDAYNTTTLVSEITSAGLTFVGNASSDATTIVGLAYGSHDAGVTDGAGIMLSDKTSSGVYYETDEYIIYIISYTDMTDSSKAATAVTAFKETMATKDSSKALFIMTHVPLHQRRNDNYGAATWLNAINDVAETFDTLVLWGHNHTGETTADTNVYYVAKGSSITPQNGSSTEINFTYANAGYITNGYMSLVTLTEDEITFQKYNSSGAYGDKQTIQRYESATVSDTATGISVTAKGLIGLTVTNKTSNATASLTINETAYTVIGVYDITPATASGSYAGSGTVTFTVSSEYDGKTLVLIDSENAVVASAAVASGSVSFTAPHFSTYTVAVASEEEEDESEGEQTVTTTEDITAPTTVTAGSSSTVTVYKKVSSITSGKNYLIVSSAGGTSNTSAYALGHSGTSVSADSVTIYGTSGEYYSQAGAYYILASDVESTSVWTAETSGSSYSFKNGDYYLSYSSSTSMFSTSYSLACSTSAAYWTYDSSNNRLSVKPGSSTFSSSYYLRYNSGWSLNSSTSSANVYLYEETELTISNSASYYLKATVGSDSTQYDYSATEADSYTYALAGVDTASESKSVTLGYAIAKDNTDMTESEITALGGTASYTIVESYGTASISSSTLTLTGAGSYAIVKVAYTWTESETTYTVYNYIKVVAEKTTYTLAITKDGSEVTGTITMKGDTKSVELVAEVTSNVSGVVSDASVTWTSSNSEFTVEGGKVTYTGESATAATTITATYTDASGTEYTATVNVSYSQTTSVVPSDGTDDFPEYPNEGAIRYNKTASGTTWATTAVAQVELSLTGVPYSTGSEIDVVMMLDLTGSMKTGSRIAATAAAAQAFLDQIVKNEDGSFNGNRVAICYFNTNGATTLYSMATVTSDNYSTICGYLTTTSLTSYMASGGTPYSTALSAVDTILDAARTDGIGNSRQQFCLFMSDGAPTSYTGTDNKSYSWTNGSYESSWFSSSSSEGYTATSSFVNEYYSSHMKNEDGVTIYTVGLGITDTRADIILKSIASQESYYYSVADENSTSELASAFADIATKIKQAATDAVVEDQISEYYTLFAGGTVYGEDNTIEAANAPIVVTEYTLDDDKNRTGTGTVIASVVLTSDASGTITGATVTYADGTTKEVTVEDSVLTIYYSDGETVLFTYNLTTKTFSWKVGTVSSTELALSYYVLLNENLWTTEATYPTNTYATITYTNYQDNECEVTYPVPQLTWNGAQVSYVFYLVNEDGDPVNRSGQVVQFNNAVFVTDTVTQAYLWSESGNTIDASVVASSVLPDVYTLYDQDAKYNVTVSKAGTSDSFTISGSDSVSNKTTTYVYNTMADTTKYNAYGTYNASTYTSFNFADTTVAFAVVWTPTLAEDSIVYDYGLSTTVNVAANDSVTGSIVGLTTTAPAVGGTAVEINKGTMTSKPTVSNSLTLSHGTVTYSGTTITYTPTDMNASASETIYYVTEVSFYQNSVKQTYYMYSSLTIIPATSVYYEAESFVTFTSSATATWSKVGTSASSVQDTDRPGANSIGTANGYDDADNNYGYDSHYTDDTTYSNNAYETVTVASGTATANLPTATFSFTGTGFDLYSCTNSSQGMIKVQVYSDSSYSTLVKTASVINTGEQTLYQIPVLSIENLDYNTYYVKVTCYAAYSSDTYTSLNRGGNHIIDAIRVYNPVASTDETAQAAYAADNEANAVLLEIRNGIIEEGTYDATSTETTDGVLYLDSKTEGSTVVDYAVVGPNNEVYFASGSETAVGFILETSAEPAEIQIGAKSVDGNAVILKVETTSTSGKTTVLSQSIASATAQNYTIPVTSTYDTASGTYKVTLYVSNGAASGSGVLSITDLKVTFASEATAAFKHNNAVALAFTQVEAEDEQAADSGEEAGSESGEDAGSESGEDAGSESGSGNEDAGEGETETVTTPSITSATILTSRVRYGRDMEISVTTNAALSSDYSFAVTIGSNTYTASTSGLYAMTTGTATANEDGTYTYVLTLKPYTYAPITATSVRIDIIDSSSSSVSAYTSLTTKIYLL